MSIVKSCSTCEHRTGLTNNCSLSGFYCSTERRYPTKCGQDYDGWVQRLGIFQRIRFVFTGKILDE